MKKNFVLVVLALLLFSSAHAERTIWYVHPDSSLNTIQAGLDSCADYDIVLVGPGTYYENIIWPNTQGIHLISELGPEVTIIDGSDTSQVMLLDGANIDTTTIVSGFIIQNGERGIHIPLSTPKIHNNLIRDNTYEGIHTCQGAPVLQENIITNNGLGLLTHGGWFELIDNIISDNTGDGVVFSPDPSDFKYSRQGINGNTFSHNGGYGINLFYGILKNATITHNGSGGIYVVSGADIDSCTIAHNYGPGVTSFEGPCVTYCERQGTHINNCDILDNIGYGVLNQDIVMLNAEYNWWGDSTGPYHPDSNPGGQGDTVSDYVDFIPWLYWPGVEEQPTIEPVVKQSTMGATIFSGPLQLPEGKQYKIFDITGRTVAPDKIKPGIYFIEVDDVVTQKVVKVR